MATQTAHGLAATAATTAYHYVITVQTPRGLMNTRGAVVDVQPGATRAQCLDYVMKPLFEEFGEPIVILFFALEPNQL
ncbi:hypothetical protein [Streptomyces sp. ISL-11]|uniref:hypothetical protein n=1 Tax=Streptomyces sp. ISL-11 TaxID=2819174 RepID=UPI001BE58519|nr:hypothetical protein [Streptomyces sp. ISL-11]MBT2383098.1 hypothetical protein [Streptomyces sp. ISL-11]